MKNVIKYKGYMGSIEYDSKSRTFHGRLMGISDIITFEGASSDELENDFKKAVNEYLADCSEIGKEPEKPFSGNLMIRIPSDLHCAVTLEAKKEGKSINSWIIDICRRQVNA